MASTTITKFAHLQIPLEEIVKATNNFHDDNIIGHGGLGSAYKGQLQWSGKSIKISALRLDRKHGKGDVEFWTEISMLSDLKHTNLVSIVGFCDEKDEKIIITTYDAKGSLKKHINNTNLTWTQRLKICIGVARALTYLHHDEGRGYGVIHLNINSSTILLDENWKAKLSGFKVSIKQSLNQMHRVVLFEPIGTIGYIDPEIGKTRGVTYKSDIYAFGVVLFEILCGRSAYIKNGANRLLAKLAKYHYENGTLHEIVHPDLRNRMFGGSLKKFSKVAYSCLMEGRAHRPHALNIVNELEKALELQLRYENIENKLEHLKIPLRDIKLATNNFSHRHEISITDNSTRYTVELDHFDNHSSLRRKYKGEGSKEHNSVLIKQFMFANDKYEGEECLQEIEVYTTVKHPNIATLLGFCVEDSEMIIIIENVANGYLADYFGYVIGKHRRFNWEKRLKICIDVAHVLNYLHYEMEDQKVVINRDINMCNIGLDENWEVKIDGFSFSIFLPPNQEDEALYLNAIGRSLYIDPEYNKTGKLKRESDVYSFGVVLLEILCGKTNFDPFFLEENKEGLAPLARQNFRTGTLKGMIDPMLMEETNENTFVPYKGPNKDSLQTFIEVAIRCVDEAQDCRPTMKILVKELEKALFFQENNMDSLRISLEDVKLATKNFQDDNCIGGEKSFGKVYKGNVPKGDGFNAIIAKRFETRISQASERFLNELQILLEYKHDNVIDLVGYCDEKDEKVIVYEYLSRTSLDKYLNDTSLTWKKRLDICIDVASAMDFLHGGVGRGEKMIIHTNIKTSNILLNDDWKAKLAGFEFSLISPVNQETNILLNHVNDPLCGTPGYVDPLFKKTGFLTIESDIYSFGVVLFEILCGRSTLTIHKDEGHYLPDFIRNNYEEGKHDEVVFEQLKEQIVPESLTTFQTIAYQCLHLEREKRPTAKEVLMQLKKALEFQEEKIQCLETNQVVNKLERHRLTSEILGMKLEHLKIPLSDIKLATENFSFKYTITYWNVCTFYKVGFHHFDKTFIEEKNKREHLKGHTSLVIKRYPSGHEWYGEEAFLTEIEMLSSVRHPNIVSLLGFCVEDSEMIIVTENVSKGFLLEYFMGDDDELRHILTWEKRLEICIDIAHMLNYLHYEMEDRKVIINRDINMFHIGLGENWEVKIADFSFSVFLPQDQENEALHLNGLGREFYSDPEYKKTGKLKRESDIYSLGVVLLEMLCGRTTFDPIYLKENKEGLAPLARQKFRIGTLEDMIDPILKEETSKNNFVLYRGPNKDSLHTFIEIAHKCVAETQDQRPTIDVVVKELKKALFFQKNNKAIRISLEDINLATQNFHRDNRIGGGGFGSVYKGNLQEGNGSKTIVAKRLDTSFGQGEQQFLSELQILLEYKHDNIIGLVGYCDEHGEKIIVYEYAPRISLDRYLNDASLTWVKRLNICIDVASALDFLHGGVGKQAKVIHRDIKTANILLNHDWKAKLADFGLSLISPITQDTNYVIDRACGTPGYLDPVYRKSGFLTIESDIYSFGVVLFEILCGRSTFTVREQEGHYLPDFIKNIYKEGNHDEMVFEKIREQITPISLTTFQDIAYQCLHHEREKRPTMKNVLIQLKMALDFQENNKENPRISLEDIKVATQNFHDDNCIGREKFGNIYKGNLPDGDGVNNIVAKRFGQGEKQFLSELQVLWQYKHKNVISLVGYCDEHDEKVVIYEYMPRGSLDMYLNDASLTWIKRLNICIDVARALDFIHGGVGKQEKVIHKDIKSASILLNHDWKAKLANFGLSSISPMSEETNYVMDCVCGTPGYVDPLYEKMGFLTIESDIYSFGVVLFEILCGRSTLTVHKDEGRYLAYFIRKNFEEGKHDEVVFEQMKEQIVPQSLTTFQTIAYRCLHLKREKRPTAKEVLMKLKRALEFQENINLSEADIVANEFERFRLTSEIAGKKLEHLKIPLSGIKLATDNFSNTNIIATLDVCTFYRVGFHHFEKMFVEKKSKQEHLKGHTYLIIKRYHSGHDCYGEQMFLPEIEVLSSVRHPNIVSLLGFCVEDSEMIIVTENVSNGFLIDYYLENGNKARHILTWEKRLQICIDIAHILNYLHYGMEDQKVLINSDINMSKFMLGENSEVKMVDFSFSLFLPPNQEDEALYLNGVGRPCYTDPEYEKTGKLKRESVVYSFGVVLLEMLCGRATFDPVYLKDNKEGLAPLARQKILTGTLEDMIDPILKEETSEKNYVLYRGPNKDSMHTFIEIALKCVAETQDQRPTIDIVMKELKKALFFQKNNKDIRISLEDINQATQNFHNDNQIGGGEFGSVL